MKNLIPFPALLLVLLTAISYAQTGWHPLPNAPVSSRIDDIWFLNTDTGIAVTSNGRIYKTSDAGNSWALKKNTGDYMRSVEFLNDSIGFAGSLYSSLFQTTDGGETWTDISNLLDPNVNGICGLNAVDDSVIYGVGVWSEPAYIIRSSNSGATWEYMPMMTYAHGLIDCYFFSRDTGFVSGIGLNGEAIILYTDNGGASWQNKFSSTVSFSYGWKIQFLDRANAVLAVASLNPNSGTEIVMSSDSGMTWNLKTVSSDYYELEGIGFLNMGHGFVGGYFNGQFETVDSGATWVQIPYGKTINRYFKVNDTLMYCSGTSIYYYTDTVSAGIPTSSEPQSPFSEIHTLKAVYPNPSTESFRIEYHLNNKTMVDLAIYSMDGKRVDRIVHQQQAEGNYSLFRSIGFLQEGEYFIVLNTNEGAVNTQFVKMAHKARRQ